MKPILFLDIDGVLNSSADWPLRRVRSPHWGQLPGWQKAAEDCIDPDAVERLNRIVEATGCAVVLSSSWRKLEPLPLMTRILRYRGFRHRLVAATPHIMIAEEGLEFSVARGREIEAWLDALYAGPRPPFAILDDDTDMDPHRDRHVYCDDRWGLTDAEVERACALLSCTWSGS